MKQSHSRHLTAMLFVLMMFASFLVGYQMNRSSVETPVWAALASTKFTTTPLQNAFSLRPVQLFQEALDHVRNEYVEPVPDQSPLVYSAIRGMLTPLKDPYTRFMDPKEYKDFTSDNVGHFVGIGATLNMVEIPGTETAEGKGTVPTMTCPVCGTKVGEEKHYRVAVVKPLDGSPAKAAGLKPGDFIMKVDGTATDGMTVGEVADRIHGLEQTTVKLTIARKGIDKPLEIAIQRANIEVSSTESKLLPDRIGYLRLLTFNEKTSTETREALQQFAKDKIQGIVLDLRNNPGGLMNESINVASMLLPASNELIVSTKGRKGNAVAYNRTSEKQICAVPMVVLVNGYSASASEILSGALKDYKRGRIVGEKTFGKALVQTVMRLSDGSAMAITTAHYYTPSGHDVGKVGVSPDVTVELDKEAKTTDETDNQAQTALKILKQEIARQ